MVHITQVCEVMVVVMVWDTLRWSSLCECVRSMPITTTSAAALFSTLVHSVHFNSSHCCGSTLLRSYVRLFFPTHVSFCGKEGGVIGGN